MYLELLRRGYEVNIGKVGTAYFQVTSSMLEESTFNREMARLKAIPVNYPKTVITLDRYPPATTRVSRVSIPLIGC